MELKEFITKSLVEIIEGVSDAQAQIGKKAVINPKPYNPKKETQAWGTGLAVQEVQFDVAVTVDESGGTKGGIGVVAGMFALGSQGHSNASSQSVSRLKFVVPLTLPYVSN